ncbi:hypothetical protein B0H10DRAFT_2088650 [Mycena sp. CBHHK59/15]|nr:hypothetical protein B0H10DRAFT_2088650 [Mycena sp. CBHHK59/15]
MLLLAFFMLVLQPGNTALPVRLVPDRAGHLHPIREYPQRKSIRSLIVSGINNRLGAVKPRLPSLSSKKVKNSLWRDTTCAILQDPNIGGRRVVGKPQPTLPVGDLRGLAR